MNRLVLIAAAVVCIGVLASPVAAQQTTDTPTPDSGTDTTTPDSGTDTTTPDSGTDTPAPDSGTDTPASDSGTDTAEPGASDRPITSPSGSPVSYDSPTPTSGDGPGFGAIGALVGVVLGTVVVARRRT